MITKENYYTDTTAISHSMLCDFVHYNEYWERFLTPDLFQIYHFNWVDKKFKNEDIVKIWLIVDEYYEKWPEVLEKYEVVSRRSWEDSLQITKSMFDTIQDIIVMWNNFKRFIDFIKLPDTKSQDVLVSEVDNIKIKWKLDFINYWKKKILDLKTTSSLDNVLKDIVFKWQINIFARYVRQLAYYNYLAGWDFDWILAILTPTEVKWLEIPNKFLTLSWEFIKTDLLELKKFIDNPNEYPKDIFEGEEEENIT
jgi:hypothetical protein